jgi:hypothetical protein
MFQKKIFLLNCLKSHKRCGFRLSILLLKPSTKVSPNLLIFCLNFFLVNFIILIFLISIRLSCRKIIFILPFYYPIPKLHPKILFFRMQLFKLLIIKLRFIKVKRLTLVIFLNFKSSNNIFALIQDMVEVLVNLSLKLLKSNSIRNSLN